jgi:TorA maturation chaperone TorD
MMDDYSGDAASFDPALNMARQSLYRFAALSLLDPLAGSWEQLNRLRDDPVLSAAAAFIRTLPAARSQELGLGERPLEDLDPQFVLDRVPDSKSAFNSLYEHTFGLLVSSACPPYETEYVDSKLAFQRSNGLADVSGFYHAFGLTTSDQRPDRPDHVVLELEFMAHLLGLERDAADDDADRRAAQRLVCREAQAHFFREHLAWWMPVFARLLGREDPQGFYATAGVFLAALISAERALLGLPAASCAVGPTMVERPELCEGCQVAG